MIKEKLLIKTHHKKEKENLKNKKRKYPSYAKKSKNKSRN